MKKIIFAAIIVLFYTQLVSAQNTVKKENYLVSLKGTHTFEEVYTTLADAYGIKNIQFVELKNGSYIPVRTDEVKGINQVQVSMEVITIFAIIGAVLVAILILRAI
jgi:hypothetical protein